jgi:NAD(P)-dependent dehydrogenase (short-subunit alcohol dehydrogenase family)
MEITLEGKTALVTGGANGLGRNIVSKLAGAGARVAYTSRDEKALARTASEIGGSHLPIFADISEAGGVEKTFSQIENQFGCVDILVNNIGHTLGITDPFAATKAEWSAVFNLNFLCHVEAINRALPSMKKNNWGRIINITSLAGLEISGPALFNSAKAALTAYTRSVGRLLAIEKTNIVMTAVAPGVVATEGGHWENMVRDNPDHAEKYLRERTALGRFGTEDEVNDIVIFLASDRASFFHGSVLQVDGGQSRHYMYHTFMD